MAWIETQLAEKSDPDYSSPTTTFTDIWLRQKDKMSHEDILLGVAANIGGAADTIDATLSVLIYLLARHPEVLARLREELDEIVSKDRLGDDGLISFESSRDAPYLQAVIKETMRLFPAVSVQLPRYVPKGGDVLAGYYFREGLSVGINPWSTRTEVKYWGEDADVFRPERWLGDGEEVKRNEYYHIPVRRSSQMLKYHFLFSADVP